MKRLISILLVVAMMLASVLAMIPASAAEKSETPTLTYNVNWKELYDGGTMKAQWVFNTSKNNFEDRFTVTATENSISFEAKDGGADRYYYSSKMFPITEDTYYEYVFEARNNPANPTGYAGVVFAYGQDDDAYIEGGDKGPNDEHIVCPYIIYGALQNKSDEGESFYLDVNYGHQNSGYMINPSTAEGVGLATADGYNTYKIVYDGYKVTIFYLKAEGEFEQIFADFDFTLPEGSKVAFGVYNREGTRNAAVRNAVLTSYTVGIDVIIAKDAIAPSIAAGDAEIAKGGYTTTSTKALTDALAAAKAEIEKAEATAETINAAKVVLDEAIAGLIIGANKKALNAKIAEAEAALTEDKFDATAFAAYKSVLDAAKAVSADVDALQPAADKALADLRAAITTLIGADKTALAAKIAEIEAMDFEKYTPVTWAPLAKALADAKKVNDSDVAFQADIDAALAAFTAPAAALVERPAVKAFDYSVNWTKFFSVDALRSQWWKDSGSGQNNYLKLYTVTATENLLSSEPIGDADNRTYYSKVMYDITADTYYEYTFKAKNNRATGYAGVMYAYDVNGTMPYFVYGEFDNKSDNGYSADFRFRAGHHDRNNADEAPLKAAFLEGDPRYYPVVTLDGDGYGQYKFVYDGFNFSFHYLDADGKYVQIGDVIVLPETAKVCPGVYSRGGNLSSQRTMSLKDCVLTAFDDADAMLIANADAQYAITLANAKIASGSYTAETIAVLTAALEAVNAEIAKADAKAAGVKALADTLYEAIINLVTKTALATELANIEALALKEADWTTTTWATFAAALANAKEINASTTATQADVDAALKALKDAQAALDPSAEGDKTALNAKIAEAEAALKADLFTAKPDEWTAYLAALDAAKKVSADKTETGNQSATDKALKDLVNAIKTLVAADKKALNDLIADANEYVEGKYEPAQWPAFAEALAAAKTISASDVALQDAIDAAVAELDAAMKALVRKPLSKKAEISVNWKYLYDNKLMKAQWFNETWQNDFEDHFTVNATENQLNVVAKKDAESGEDLSDVRAYYSTNMYKITATTYYEYTFKVKRDSVLSTYAGVIFAYDTTSVSDNQLAYIFYGGLNNLSDDGENSYISIQYGHQDSADRIAGPVKKLVVGVDGDNFATYKIVYDGYWASFYYTDPTTGEFVLMPELTVKLKETAAVCVGTYTRDNRDADNQRTVTQKDCKLVAMNDEAAGYMAVNKTALAAKLAEVEALNENEYTTATWTLLKDAYLAAKAVNEDANALQVMVDAALAAVVDAQGKLGKPGDSTALKAKIAEAEALKAEDYKSGLTWNVFAKALADAKAAAESRDSTQGDIDMALSTLVEAMGKIEKKPAAAPAPETDAPATDAPETDAPATEAPTDDDKKDDEEEKDGCGSSVALSALAIVSVIGTALVIKKKED